MTVMDNGLGFGPRYGGSTPSSGILCGIYPARGLAFIKHVQTSEQYPNSPILIPVQARDKLAKMQFEIVAVGDYEYCDSDECERYHTKRTYCFPTNGERSHTREHRHFLKESDWVLVRNRSWSATPDPNVFVVRQDAILGKFSE